MYVSSIGCSVTIQLLTALYKQEFLSGKFRGRCRWASGPICFTTFSIFTGVQLVRLEMQFTFLSPKRASRFYKCKHPVPKKFRKGIEKLANPCLHRLYLTFKGLMRCYSASALLLLKLPCCREKVACYPLAKRDGPGLLPRMESRMMGETL